MDDPVKLSNALADLAEETKSIGVVMVAAQQSSASVALRLGTLLAEAKRQCRHGSWGPFLERASMAERQAQRLMQIAQSGLSADTVSDLVAEEAGMGPCLVTTRVRAFGMSYGAGGISPMSVACCTPGNEPGCKEHVRAALPTVQASTVPARSR